MRVFTREPSLGLSVAVLVVLSYVTVAVTATFDPCVTSCDRSGGLVHRASVNVDVVIVDVVIASGNRAVTTAFDATPCTRLSGVRPDRRPPACSPGPRWP